MVEGVERLLSPFQFALWLPSCLVCVVVLLQKLISGVRFLVSTMSLNIRYRTSSMFRKRSLSNNMLAEPQGDTLKVGYLRKKGHVRRNWLDRWFVLTTDGLYYYKSKEESKPLGVIPLIRGEVREDTTGRHQYVFTCVTIEGKDYCIQASTRDEMFVWIKVISDAMHNATVKSNTKDASSVAPVPIPEESSSTLKVENGEESPKKGAVAQATRKSTAKSEDYDSWDEDEDD